MKLSDPQRWSVTVGDRENNSSEESEQFPNMEPAHSVAAIMAYTADGPLPPEFWENLGEQSQTLKFSVGKMGRPPQIVTMVRGADGGWVEL